MSTTSRILRLLRCLLLGLAGWAGWEAVAADAGNEVVVVYNQRVGDSRRVAEHYARRRGVPTNQVVGFELSDGGSMPRREFDERLQRPLMAWLETNGLAEWKREESPATKNLPAGVRHTLVRSRVRYLVLCFGIPWYIPNDPTLREPTNGIPDVFMRNDACLDQDLALLPRLGWFNYQGFAPNPFANSTNAAEIRPENGAFVVTRIDGPTPEIAMGIVDKAIEAEAKGLWGHAYIDLRGLTSGPYLVGDQMITNAASAAKRLGFETFVDNRPETLGTGYPMSQIGLYVGWYESHVVGPFAAPTMEFLPGAFAYHLHSFSGASVRSRDEWWVGPLLAKGATCTMGCVAEPYLSLTPHPSVFLERWGFLGMTFGEAAATCHPMLSWQTVVVGDPLYRPFRLNPVQYGEMLALANSPLTAYALVRKVNIDILNRRVPMMPKSPPLPRGRDLSEFEILARNREMLESQPLAEKSSVVAEKIARLYWNEAKAAQAVKWYAHALAASDTTPRQRIRLLLDSVEAYRVLDRPKAAYEALEEVLRLDPTRDDVLRLRNRQLQFARDLRDKDLQEGIRMEIRRLTATNPPSSSK